MKWFLHSLYVTEKIIYWPTRTVMGVALFLNNFRWGLYYGYPLCCITQFSLSRALGIHKKQGLRRGGVRLSHTKVYVPCSYHKRRHPDWRPHKQWLAEELAFKGKRIIKETIVIGQNSLNNFYQSVKFTYPTLAARMSEDIIIVALNGLSADKSEGQPAADRLREQAQTLPVALIKVLDNALTELGYS